MQPSRFSWIDRSALGLSGLCLLHCVAGSLLLTLLAVGGGLWNHDVHAVGLAAALPLAAFALWRGLQQHQRSSIVMLGASGLGLMAASLVIGHGSDAELVLSVAGVALLGAAHWLNMRWLRRLA